MCKCTPAGHEVHPPATARVNFFLIFRTVFAEWLRCGGIFRRSVRATTKKGRQLFWQKKVHPQTKSWLRLWRRMFGFGEYKNTNWLNIYSHTTTYSYWAIGISITIYEKTSSNGLHKELNGRTASRSEWTVGESSISAVNTWSCCLRTYSSTVNTHTHTAGDIE